MIKKEDTGSPTIEINPEFQKALDLMEDSHRHVFITGRAGTGKSSLLGYFCDHTEKAVVVLAPTGVAAINVGGQTIHSFFRFKPDVIPSAIKRRSGDEKKNPNDPQAFFDLLGKAGTKIDAVDTSAWLADDITASGSP